MKYQFKTSTDNLWFDMSRTDEKIYHVFSIQVREKYDVKAISIIFLRWSVIFTWNILERLLNKICR